MKYLISINSMATGKIPAGDPRWATFNDCFVARELEPVEIANEIYTGHAYAAIHQGRRKLENFVCAQHIALDMDTGDERSGFDALRGHALVAAYAGLMHTTPSHRADAPRARVMFFLDRPITTVQAFDAAARFLIAQFDGADPACKDASRFFYGAKGCDIWLSDNVLPLSHLRRFYRIWSRTAQEAAPAPQPTQPKRHTLPAQPGDKLAEVETALHRIDALAIDYNKWIAILAALHDEFGDRALSLAVQWGKGYDGEVERKWKSFGNYAGRRAGLGTIFELAKVH